MFSAGDCLIEKILTVRLVIERQEAQNSTGGTGKQIGTPIIRNQLGRQQRCGSMGIFQKVGIVEKPAESCQRIDDRTDSECTPQTEPPANSSGSIDILTSKIAA